MSIENIKSKTTIDQIIGDYVKLKRHGSGYVGLCPFHDERTPSFQVSPAKDLFKCFGCGKSGDGIDFISLHQNIPISAAIQQICAQYNIPMQEKKREYSAPLPRLEKISPEFIQYFESRKITNNTLLRFGVSEAFEWMPKAQKQIKTVCFNYFRDGELVNIKFRGPQKDFKLNKDSELIFYNLDAIQGEKECVIVEGEIDALTLYECGIHNVVSVPNGAAPGKQSLEYLDNCWQYFAGMDRVMLMVDNDEPGYNLRNELARRIGYEKCYRVEYPEGCKDANDVLVQKGTQYVKQMYDNAQQWPIEGIVTMNDMYEDILNAYQNGYPGGIEAGIPEFDEFLTFMPGQLTTITGVPGSGKSEYIDYIMACLSKKHEWSWGIYSFENQPSYLHATKLMEKFAGKSFEHRKNHEHRMTSEEFNNSLLDVRQYFNFVNMEQADITIDGMLTKAKELVVRKGINGLLIDPWNQIEHKIPNGYSETQYISEALAKIKAFALKTGVHVFLVAHPTKLKKENGKYEVPTMYSISGSAHFFNKTDNGITVWRDFETNRVDIYIQKVRYSWLGKIGFFSTFFNTFTRQYSSLPPETY